MIRPLVFILSLALLLATVVRAAAAAAAPPVAVSAEVSSAKTYVGDPVLLRIVVEGSSTPQQPTLPAMKDLSADFLGGTDASSHFVTIINGRRSDQSSIKYIFQYRLTPARAGILKVPAIPVVVDGTTYTTMPIGLEVVEPKQSSDFRLTVSLAKKEAYVGEPVKATIVWYLAKDARNFSFSMPAAEGAFEMLPGRDPRPTGVAPVGGGGGGASDPRYAEVPFLDGNAVGAKAMTTIDGRQFMTLTIERIVVARRDGSLTIGPLRAAFDAIVGQRRPNFFDTVFDDRSVTERTVIAAEPVTLAVKPLPVEGRPANFTGLIGAYSIESSATPTAVNVGDPIALSVIVRGPEPLELVQPLAMDRQRSLTESFKIPSDTVFPKIAGGAATFSYALRARSDRVTQIPPIELPYFDTAAGAYRTAASKPIPLTVRPTKDIAYLGDDTPDKSAADDRPGGLAPIRRSNSALRSQWLDLRAVLGSPIWMAAIAGPPAVYFLGATIVLARRRASRDPLAARRRRATGRASRALAQAARLPADQAPAAVSAAVRRFIADLAGRPEQGLTAEECVTLVSHSDPANAARLDQLLRRCEAARFAPPESAPSGPGLVGEARSLVSEIRLRASPPSEGARGGRRVRELVVAAPVIAMVLLLPLIARADTAPPPTPEDLLIRAAAAYDAGVARLGTDRPGAIAQFQQSAAACRALIDQGHVSGPLFYDLGNSLLQAGDTGRAILSYRRAERFMPFDKDLKSNLGVARERLGAGALPVPPLRPEQPVLSAARLISARARMEAFVILIGAGWLLALGRLCGLRPSPGRWLIIGLALAGLLSVGSLLAEANADHAEPRGVVVADTQTRTGPSEAIHEAGSPARLPAGTEFILRGASPGAGWSQIRLGNGNELWVPTDSIELVQPG